MANNLVQSTRPTQCSVTHVVELSNTWSLNTSVSEANLKYSIKAKVNHNPKDLGNHNTRASLNLSPKDLGSRSIRASLNRSPKDHGVPSIKVNLSRNLKDLLEVSTKVNLNPKVKGRLVDKLRVAKRS